MNVRGWSWLFCSTFVVLALAYNALLPIGEGPDELAHFEYIRMLAERHRLPRAADDRWQGHQAPLYYVIGAAWSRVIEGGLGCRMSAEKLPSQENPRFLRRNDYSYLLHPPTERVGHWRCEEWAFHLLRVLSTALAVPTILLTMAIVRRAAPEMPVLALLGGAIVALLPSHVALSAMLNNDALVNMLVVATTYLLVCAYRTGESVRMAQALVLASVATATKLSGLFLFGLWVLTLAMRRDLVPALLDRGAARGWRVAALLSLSLPLAVVTRNLVEWGDLFGVRALEINLTKLIGTGANPRHSDPVAYYFVDMPDLFVNAFMVAYGAINLRFTGAFEPGRWGPRIVLAGLLLSVGIRSVWRRVDRGVLLLLGGGFVLFFASYFYPGYRYRWLQVRYFFNQLPLLALVAAIGIETLATAVRRFGVRLSDGTLVAATYVALVALNVYVLYAGVIRYVYRYVGTSG